MGADGAEVNATERALAAGAGWARHVVDVVYVSERTVSAVPAYEEPRTGGAAGGTD